MKKRVIIFGATGGTGRELVREVMSQGYDTTAFVRHESKLKEMAPGLSFVKGDVLNQSDVTRAIQGHDVVMVSLGMPASDKTTLRADGTAHIIRAMHDHGVKRLICQTSLGYADSAQVLPWHMKYIIVPYILKNAFKDHELQEGHITATDLDWTIVRPGNMTNGKRTGVYKVAFEPTAKIKLKVSRADVAQFMTKQIADEQYIGHKVGVSY